MDLVYDTLISSLKVKNNFMIMKFILTFAIYRFK